MTLLLVCTASCVCTMSYTAHYGGVLFHTAHHKLWRCRPFSGTVVLSHTYGPSMGGVVRLGRKVTTSLRLTYAPQWLSDRPELQSETVSKNKLAKDSSFPDWKISTVLSYCSLSENGPTALHRA